MATTLHTGWLARAIDGVKTKVYAWSHAKCCYYGDPADGVTVEDKIDELNSSLTYSTTNVIGETYATSSLKVYKRGNVCELVGTLTINKTFSVQSGIVTIDDACAPVVGGNWIPVKAMTTNGAEYPFFLIGTALYSIAGVSYPSGATIVFGDSCWLSK